MQKVKLNKGHVIKDKDGNEVDIAPHHAGRIGILSDNGLVCVGNLKYKFNKKHHEIINDKPKANS